MSDDNQVIRRVLAGDVEAFGVLVERHQGRLAAYVRNLLPRGAAWEDVAQDAFLAAYQSLSRFDARRATFGTYLLAIARNRCLNLLKGKVPLAGGAMAERVDPQTPADAVAAKELFGRLDAALAALPAEQRSAFVLAEVMELSYEEIAKIEPAPLGTLRSRVSRARAQLRSALGSADGERA